MVEPDDRLAGETAPAWPETPAKGPAKPAFRPARRARITT